MNFKNYRCAALLSLIIGSLLTNSCGDDFLPIPEVTVSEIWTSGLAISWSGTSGQLSIQISEDDGFSTLKTDTLTDKREIELENLESGKSYYLRYQFINGGEKSKYSDGQLIETSALVPPQNLSVRNVIGDEIQLAWTEFTGAIFECEVSFNADFTDLVGIRNNRTYKNELLIDPLTPETTYYVRIKSTNGDQESDWLVLDPITTGTDLFFVLKSEDFENNETLNGFHSCDGPSPELHWKNGPEGTVTYALTMIDLDFGNGFNHWIVFNILPTEQNIPQGAEGSEMPSGAREGTNDLGDRGYFGPCPPAGESHRYVFTLYALDKEFDFGNDIRDTRFVEEIEPHVLSKVALRFNYE